MMFAIVGLIALFVFTSKGEFGDKTPRSFAQLGGDFTLQSLQGDVSLSDFEGKVVVMYFGFMSCPEVCPNSMGVIKSAFSRLSEEQTAGLQGIMVSVDPERDSLQALELFTQHFHKNIVGLTGSEEALKAVGKQYGAYFKKVKDKDNDYLFEHVSRYYVINQKGQLVEAMRHSTSPNELAARIKLII